MTVKFQTQLEQIAIQNFNMELDELKKVICYDLALESQRKNLTEALSRLLKKDVHKFDGKQKCEWISRWDDLQEKEQQNYLTLMKQAKDIIEHINNIHPDNPSPNLNKINYGGLTQIKDHSEILLNDFKKTVNDISPRNTNKFIAIAALAFASIACFVGGILLITTLFLPNMDPIGIKAIGAEIGAGVLFLGFPLTLFEIAPNIPEKRGRISQSSYNFFKTAKNNQYDENGFGESFKRNYCKL